MTTSLTDWLTDFTSVYCPCLRTGFSIFHLCGKIWPQTSPIKCIPLWNVTFHASHQEVESISPPLELCWSWELLWPMEWGKSNTIRLPRLGLKRSCRFYLPSLTERTLLMLRRNQECEATWREVQLLQLAQPPANPPIERSCMKEHRQHLQKSCPANPQNHGT